MDEETEIVILITQCHTARIQDQCDSRVQASNQHKPVQLLLPATAYAYVDAVYMNMLRERKHKVLTVDGLRV